MSEESGTTAVPAEVADETVADDAAARDVPPGEQTGARVREQPDARPAIFRAVPTVALVALGFLALCLSPIAFQGGAWFLLFAVPVVAAVWVVRTRTRVDTAGLHVRGLARTRSLAWEDVATLRLAERGWVHAVPHDGADLELRGVRVRDLGRVGDASGGRISAPSPADAEAAAEHARELEAVRMRVARLREQDPDGEAAADGTGTSETSSPETSSPETPSPETPSPETPSTETPSTETPSTDAVRADGGGVGSLRADTDDTTSATGT